MKIQTNKSFNVPAEGFAVSAPSAPYTLQYSADGVTFSDYEETIPANEVLFVSGLPKNAIYKLKSNTTEDLYIQY